MAISELPPQDLEKYERKRLGYYGELGQGANVSIKFIQTAIKKQDLDEILLVESIPGSEKWRVRDLFQRDVDRVRVLDEILPYLQATDKVKFFNPLTLALLPMESGGNNIERELRPLQHRTEEIKGHIYDIYEADPFFEFRVHRSTPAYSSVHWNKDRVRLVAIDGQHRLFALKRWKAQPAPESQALDTWTIPVVVLGLFTVKPANDEANLLEVVRRTFMYINSKAEAVSEARQILLNDESVLAVCTQELLEHAHSNDSLPAGQRDATRVPLMFFDWRVGTSTSGLRTASPTALVTIEELHACLGCYVIGEDWDPGSQDQALGLGDLVPPLEREEKTGLLSWKDANRLRTYFQKALLPGLTHFFQNFEPYQKYIKACRDLEAREASDLGQHAFMRLRFGTSNEEEILKRDVDTKVGDLREKFAEEKQDLADLLLLDIGFRGLLAAFGQGKVFYDDWKGTTCDWLDYARWLTPLLSKLYRDGWFSDFDSLKEEKRSLLTHVAWDHTGRVEYYRQEHVAEALGPFLLLLAVAQSTDRDRKALIKLIWDDKLSALQGMVQRGYVKEWRARLKNQLTEEQLKQEVKKKAAASMQEWMNSFEGEL